jgi:methionyl aminopeptidase
VTPLSKDEIKQMQKVCQLAAQTLYHTAKFIRPGITTDELDKIAHDHTLANDAKPSPLGYHGFPKSICTSVNDVICHGVPDQTVLKEGDIINLDITSYKFGFHGDTSATFIVGQGSEIATRITEVAKRAMEVGIEAITPGGMTEDIGFATNKYVTRAGFHTVKQIGGHGIGRVFHTDPFVPAFGKKGRGEKIIPWTCFTVEPMVNEFNDEIVEHDIPNSSIKWYTTEKGLSAQFEHTILITDTGYEILTAY